MSFIKGLITRRGKGGGSKTKNEAAAQPRTASFSAPGKLPEPFAAPRPFAGQDSWQAPVQPKAGEPMGPAPSFAAPQTPDSPYPRRHAFYVQTPPAVPLPPLGRAAPPRPNVPLGAAGPAGFDPAPPEIEFGAFAAQNPPVPAFSGSAEGAPALAGRLRNRATSPLAATMPKLPGAVSASTQPPPVQAEAQAEQRPAAQPTFEAPLSTPPAATLPPAPPPATGVTAATVPSASVPEAAQGGAGSAIAAGPAAQREAQKPIEPPSGRARTRLLGFQQDAGLDVDPFNQPAAQAHQPIRFPTGWLLIIEGPGRGACFTLTEGVSQIGRGPDQPVRLDFGDLAISRQGHASIAFDNEIGQFYLGHGGKSNVVRLNGRPVLSTQELASGDHIRIGETTLVFVALCGPEFSWSVTPEPRAAAPQAAGTAQRETIDDRPE